MRKKKRNVVILSSLARRRESWGAFHTVPLQKGFIRVAQRWQSGYSSPQAKRTVSLRRKKLSLYLVGWSNGGGIVKTNLTGLIEVSSLGLGMLGLIEVALVRADGLLASVYRSSSRHFNGAAGFDSPQESSLA